MTTTSKIVTKTGFELLNEALENTATFKTDVNIVDEILLDGGIKTGQIVEIFGDVAVGKTQFALNFCAKFLLQSSTGKILYIDTTGSFEAYRLAEILVGMQPSLNEDLLKSMLSRMMVVTIWNGDQLVSILRCLLKGLKSQLCDTKVLIVDHVASILSPITADCKAGGFSRLRQTSLLLRRVARQLYIAVLLINQCTMIQNEQAKNVNCVLKPCLGQWWSSTADFSLLLDMASNHDHENTRLLTLFAAKNKKVTPVVSKFRLSNEGLIEVE